MPEELLGDRDSLVFSISNKIPFRNDRIICKWIGTSAQDKTFAQDPCTTCAHCLGSVQYLCSFLRINAVPVLSALFGVFQ